MRPCHASIRTSQRKCCSECEWPRFRFQTAENNRLCTDTNTQRCAETWSDPTRSIVTLMQEAPLRAIENVYECQVPSPSNISRQKSRENARTPVINQKVTQSDESGLPGKTPKSIETNAEYCGHIGNLLGNRCTCAHAPMPCVYPHSTAEMLFRTLYIDPPERAILRKY